jgi:CHAT domain-containing protein
MNKKYFSIKILFLFFFLVLTGYSWAQIKKDTIEATRLFRQADSLFRAADYESSSKCFDGSAEVYKKYALWKQYFICESRIVENFSRQGKCDEAIALALTSLNSVKDKKLNGAEQEALLLNQLGYAYLTKGRNDLALENLKKAIEILSSLKKINKTELASCYKNLGLANWSAANNELALEHLQKALSLRKEIYKEDNTEIADIYNNIGLVYSSTDPDKALEYYTKALEIYEKAYGKNHPNVAIATNNIAIIQRKQKKYDEALANFQKVLYVWESMNKGRHPNEAFVYTNVGQVYSDRGELDKALEFQNKALEIYKENYGEKHPEIASIYNQIGSIYASKSKYKLALENYQKAICANVSDFNSNDYRLNPKIGNYYNANILLNSLLLKARILETQYVAKTLKPADLKLSVNSFYSCDTLIEKIRKVQTNKNDKIELGNLAASVYEDAIRVCMALREGTPNKNLYNEKAFYFAEKSKTAVLLEAISDSDAKHFANIPDSLLEKEKFIKTEISFYEQKLAEKSDPAKEQVFRDKLFSLNRQYENFISAMEKQFPEYYNLKYNVKASTVKSLQNVLNKESALVSYFIADESKRVYIFYISAKKFEVYDVAENEILGKLLVGYRNAIRFDAQEMFAEVSYQLYRQLLPFSFKSSLKKLIIIPDGKLGTIPFEAFLTKKVNPEKDKVSAYPFLIKNCAVVYSYSANLYEQSMQKPSRASGEIFLCAPIDFPGKGMVSLPATEEEVNSIRKLFQQKGIEGKSFLGKTVQESLVKSGELTNYKYIHFATHGMVDENKPELSAIYLASDSTKKEDGNLYSGEIYNLKMKVDLVTLSACQTGLGKVQKGEGIIGLSRALLYAGAQNLIVSLWSVADKSTSLLMIDFYDLMLKDNLSNGDYSYALRKAKLKMIGEGQFSKPFYWAPFILIGK